MHLIVSPKAIQPGRCWRALLCCLPVLLGGCSSHNLHPACESNTDCQSAFGWGQVCGDDGLCSPVPAEARCTRTFPEDLLSNREAYRNYVVLGSVYEAVSFPKEVNAIELAFRQVAESGDLEGRQFGLIVCDVSEGAGEDGLDEDSATTAMSTWLKDSVGVPAIVGPATSGHATYAFQTVPDQTRVLISPSATSPALSSIDGLTKSDAEPGTFWRTVPPDSLQGEVIAQTVTDSGAAEGRTLDVAVVYQAGAYGEGLALAFTDQYPDHYTLLSFENDTTRDSAVVEGGSGAFDVVLFISSDRDDIVKFLNAAALQDGYVQKDPGDADWVQIFLSDAAYDTSILEETSSSAAVLFPQIVGTRPSVPEGSIYNQFIAGYASNYQGEDASTAGFTAHAYDAAWLLIYGAAWAQYQNGGVIDGLGIARGLRRVSSGDGIEIVPTSWTDVKAHFADGLSIDVTGASGALDFDPTTEETSAPIDLWVVDEAGTGFETVATVGE